MSRCLPAVILLAACAEAPPTDLAPGIDTFVAPQPAGPGREVLVCRLEHARAEEVVLLLNDLLNDSVCRPRHPQPPAPAGLPPSEWPESYVHIAVAAGNRVVVDAAPWRLRDARELVRRLDEPAGAAPGR